MFAEVPAASNTPTTVYTVLYILLGVGALVGTGGLFGLWRYAKKQGVRDDRIDITIAAVLDPATGSLTRITALAEQSAGHSRALKRIEEKITSNGGDTHHIGDVAIRVERAITDIAATLNTHIGEHNERDQRLADRVTKLEAKP